uniref:Cytotoxic translational repressor of toxin-antitoxin stability system n=1 Tax=Desulfatirhabdium butyrativorans TaxID=340467 RepID=A0A7C4VRB1_9BACT
MNTWRVILSNRVGKQIARLPLNVKASLFFLLAEIERYGPVRGKWPNYGKLNDITHHCHIKKGKPCYVAIWEVIDRKIKLIEVKYVGTHEKAPY